MVDATHATELGQALAFVGNSLLKPMSHTPQFGLDPEFWETFPTFGSGGVTAACDELAAVAKGLSKVDDPVGQVSYEFTRLFAGPPKPAAFPWESYYVDEGITSGFGAPTLQMQTLLKEHGLQVSNENNQYADHIGIELLLASELCTRGEVAALSAFVDEHPGWWIGRLREAVEDEFPGSYVSGLVGLAQALLSL